MNEEVIVRPYCSNDIKFLLDMTNEDDWDMSHVDCRASLAVDANGLSVAEDKMGAPVGFIGHFAMLPGMVYVGAFIVRKDLHRKGIGKKLLSAMLDATKGNILVVDCISSIKNWYKNPGFHYEAYCSRFCKGTTSSTHGETDICTCNIIPVSDNEWPALIAYDRKIYPYDRESVLQAWFRGPETYSVVALHNECVVGFGNFHWKLEKECNIRALYADDTVRANELLMNLLQNIPVGTIVSFDLMIDKPMPKCFSDFQIFDTIHRLYTKDIRGFCTDKIFFCTTYMV